MRNENLSMPLHEKVYEKLSNFLMQGNFYPGQKLSLRQLAEELGTSTAPVREAVQRLSVLGAIIIYPKKYIYVPKLTTEKYLDILEIRTFLEGRAIVRACENIGMEEIKILTKINAKILHHAKRKELKEAMKENQKFLFFIYKNAKSDILLEMIEHLWLLVGPSVNKYLTEEFSTNPKALKAGFSNHKGLIAAFKNKDPEAAYKAKLADLQEGAKLLISALKAQSEFPQDTVLKK